MSEANKKVVNEFFAAFARGDAEAAVALLADDVNWTLIGTTPISGTYEGKQAVVEDFLGTFASLIDHDVPIEIEVLEVIGEGDKVVARTAGKMQGKHGEYNNLYCHVFTVREGLIRENREFADTELIARALYGK